MIQVQTGSQHRIWGHPQQQGGASDGIQSKGKDDSLQESTSDSMMATHSDIQDEVPIQNQMQQFMLSLKLILMQSRLYFTYIPIHISNVVSVVLYVIYVTLYCLLNNSLILNVFFGHIFVCWVFLLLLFCFVFVQKQNLYSILILQ